MFCVWTNSKSARWYFTSCCNSLKGNVPKGPYCPFCGNYILANGMGRSRKRIKEYEHKQLKAVDAFTNRESEARWM